MILKDLISKFSIIAVALSFTGCASNIGSKNTKYIATQQEQDSKYSTVSVCRPSLFAESVNSAGLTVNGEPVTEIGNNEIHTIYSPRVEKISIEFTLPNKDILSKPKSMVIENLEKGSVHYFGVVPSKSLLEVGLSSVFGGTITTTWSAAKISESKSNELCKSAKKFYWKYAAL
jgi:hypothetical protein